MRRIPLIAGLVLACAIAQGQTAPLEYYYQYEGDRIGLTLDTTRVAVWIPHGTQADILDAADELNIAHSGIDAATIDEWHYLLLGEADDAAIPGLVAALAGSPNLDFVSPVFEWKGLTRYVTPWILCGQKDGVAVDAIASIVQESLPATIDTLRLGTFDNIHRLRHESKNGFVVLDDANLFDRHPLMDHAAPDWIQQGRKHLIPNDPQFGDLWGIRNTAQFFGGIVDRDIDGNEAWDTTTGEASVRVIVLDDGVQSAHPDLNSLTGNDFTNAGTGTGQPGNSCDNHGTAVAGCIAAKINNSIGVVGVAPDCRVRSAKIGVSDSGSPCPSSFFMFDSWYVSALGWSQTNGEITNASLSLGFGSSISSAYTSSRNAGVTHFASTGNDSDSSINYPSSLSTVMAVGALDIDGFRASFSNFGSGIAFSAPGVSIRTTDRTGSAGYTSGSYDWFGGTSAASPYAAGVAALGLSVDPSLTPAQLETAMEEACVNIGSPGYDTTYGWGFVNANNLVDALTIVPPDDPPALDVLFPTLGPTSGGTPITITGTNFTPDTTVLIGTGTLQNPVFVDSNTITGETPATATANTVTVFVTNPFGSDNLPNAFTYTDNHLGFQSASGVAGGSATVAALLSHDEDLEGYSIAGTYDTLFLDLVDISVDGTLAASADFVAPNSNDVEGWYTLGVIMNLAPPVTLIPAADNNPLAYLTFDIESFASTGSFLSVSPENGVGDPAVDNIFVILGGTSASPSMTGGLVQVTAGVTFIRGDVNEDGLINIADAVSALDYLFSGGPADCLDAVDVNDDGMVNVADPIYELEFLFSAGPQPPAPFPNPGLDPTADGLGC